MIYRIDADQAGGQALWFVLGPGLCWCHGPLPARHPRAGALPLHDRRGGHRAAAAPARAGHRQAGQRRLPGDRLGPLSFQPAEFAKLAIIVFLASYLRDTADVLLGPGDARCGGCPGPPRRRGLPDRLVLARRGPRGHGPAGAVRRLAGRGPAGAPVAQALRAAAPGLGPGDGHADLHPRPGQLADVLRRLPRAAVRRHRPAVAGGRRGDDVPGRRHLLRQQRQPRARARRRLAATRSRRSVVDRRGLPDRPVHVRPGRRRAVRAGLRPGAARVTRGRDAPARRGHRPDLFGVVNEIGLFGAVALLLAYLLFVVRGFKTALQAPATTSPSCWPRA